MIVFLYRAWLPHHLQCQNHGGEQQPGGEEQRGQRHQRPGDGPRVSDLLTRAVNGTSCITIRAAWLAKILKALDLSTQLHEIQAALLVKILKVALKAACGAGKNNLAPLQLRTLLMLLTNRSRVL